jgi:hypothetical protein
MIMGRDLLGELGIIMNLNDQTVTWDSVKYWHYFNKGQIYSILSAAEALIEIYWRTNEPKALRDEYSRANKVLDADYNQLPTILNEFIKACENLHLEEQHQLKILLQKYEPSISIWWNISRIQHESDGNQSPNDGS